VFEGGLEWIAEFGGGWAQRSGLYKVMLEDIGDV